jgi:hypothetical protein
MENDLDWVKAEAKHLLAKFIRDRERGLPASAKNPALYDDNDEIVYKEFLRAYQKDPSAVFESLQKPPSDKDPFRPPELPQKRRSDTGAPQRNVPKRRKPSRILRCVDVNVEENITHTPNNHSQPSQQTIPFSIQRRITTAIRNKKRSPKIQPEQITSGPLYAFFIYFFIIFFRW